MRQASPDWLAGQLTAPLVRWPQFPAVFLPRGPGPSGVGQHRGATLTRCEAGIYTGVVRLHSGGLPTAHAPAPWPTDS